jgi:tripartite-type tricarboxylate transporter receptor subunit TctC
MKKMTHHLTLVSLGLALCFGSANLWAQSAANYPDKPVKVIIPFPPGGTLDKIGRMLALKMGEQLGQNFVVENRPGGNGIIGADVVAKSNADGYTLLFNASTFVTAPMTMKSVPYKVQTDFTPIAFVASAPLSIAVSNKLGVSDVKGLAAAAKANPGKMNFAVGSIGSAGHLCTVKLEQATGTQITIVPYKGTGPALNDVLGGTVPVMFSNLPATLPHIRSGKLIALGLTDTIRTPVASEIPTLAEQGIAGVVVTSWYGLLAPAGTPPALVEQLARDAAEILAQSAVREQLRGQGLSEATQRPAQFAAHIQQETQTWARIIRARGISAQ